MYFKECEKCGANLDPGEKCDCESVKNAYVSKVENLCKEVEGQLSLEVKKIMPKA